MCAVKDIGLVVIIMVTKASFETGLPKVWNRRIISSQWESRYLTCWFCSWTQACFFFSFPYLSCSCSCLCGVYACICLCICVVYMNIHVEARGQYCVSSSVILSFIFKTGSHWTWRWLIWLDYPVSWLCICPRDRSNAQLHVGPRAHAASSHWTSQQVSSCRAALPKEHVATMCSAQAGKWRKKPYPEGALILLVWAAPLAALCSFPGLWLDKGRDSHRESKCRQVTGRHYG